MLAQRGSDKVPLSARCVFLAQRLYDKASVMANDDGCSYTQTLAAARHKIGRLKAITLLPQFFLQRNS